jgi:hypothetical protein
MGDAKSDAEVRLELMTPGQLLGLEEMFGWRFEPRSGDRG